MRYRIGLIAIVLGLALAACERNDPSPEDGQFDNRDISEWVYEWMNTLYFWSDLIPQNTGILNFEDPAGLFFSILNRPEDRFSTITSDFESFFADLQGSPLSMGYSPAFGLVDGTSKVFIIVEFVYEDTPASEAGLKRGDIIVSIDNQGLDTLNYFQLYSQTEYSVQLGNVSEGQLLPNGESLDLRADVISTDPILMQEVIETGGKKIGYLVFAEFISGSNDIFINRLNDVISSFNAQGIDELVLDLRYNPGGEISVAGHLASTIAPSSVKRGSDVLVSFVYNDFLSDFFLEEDGPSSPNLVYPFPSTPVSLNMDRVVILTGRGTASASELLITGLDPYMEVVTVGETTVGKYTGSWVWPDTEEPPRHNWAIIPIVLKYANALGLTEFKDGLDPDHFVEDDLFQARAFGDPSDPILAKALEILTGIEAPALRTTGLPLEYHSLENPGKVRKQRLLIPAPDKLHESVPFRYLD